MAHIFSHRRLSLSLISNLASEALGKIVPILILSIAQHRLGLEGFGYAQLGIALMEFCFPLISFGYNHWGSIALAQVPAGSSEEGKLVSNILALKLLHSTVIFLALIAGCLLIPAYDPYLMLVLALGGSLFFTAIELLWVQIGRQKLAAYGVFTLGSKILSLILIWLFVTNPQQSILFASLSLGANVLTCLATFVYCFRPIAWQKPQWEPMLRIWKQSRGFALITVYAIFIERVDLFLVERLFTLKEVGVYAGILRINNTILQFIWAIGLVLFSESITAKSDDHLKRYVQLSLFVFSALLTPIGFGVWFVDREIVTIIYDDQFLPFASLLSLMLLGNVGSILIFVFGQQVLQVKGAVYQLFFSLFFGFLIFLCLLGMFHDTVYQLTSCHILGKFLTGLILVTISSRWVTPKTLFVTLRTIIPGSIMGFGLYMLPRFPMLITIGIGAVLYALALGIGNYGWIKRQFESYLLGKRPTQS